MLEEEERLGSIIFMLIYVIPFLVVIVGAKHNSDNLSCCQAKERMHACIVRRAEKLAGILLQLLQLCQAYHVRD